MPRKPPPTTDAESTVSKSQLKRDMKALQSLGEKIIQLPDGYRAQIPMDDDLREAIALALRLRGKREAYRRHLQYMGKLLRNMDCTPLEQALQTCESQAAAQNAHFHALEALRDRLILEGNPAIDTLIGQHHELDRQKLRQLVKTAQKEREQEKPPTASRVLFRYLRDTLNKIEF